MPFIHVSGHLDGRATFLTPHGLLRVGPRRVSQLVVGEFYESSATIEYAPQDVTHGHLFVEYKFETF